LVERTRKKRAHHASTLGSRNDSFIVELTSYIVEMSTSLLKVRKLIIL
jgi:hypothetical protein